MTTVAWLTGLSGSGKTTLARAVASRMEASGRPALVLDGDDLRKRLCRDLGFSRGDRHTQALRAAAVAAIAARQRIPVVVALVSPYRASRAAAKVILETDLARFVEVFIDTPLETCRQRKPKVYDSKLVSGVDDPYEPPVTPDLVVKSWQFDWAVEQIHLWMLSR